MSKYDKCPACGAEAVHLANALGVEELFHGDQDDDEDGESKYADKQPPLEFDVSLFAHICFDCGHLVDVGIETPREKSVNTNKAELDELRARLASREAALRKALEVIETARDQRGRADEARYFSDAIAAIRAELGETK